MKDNVLTPVQYLKIRLMEEGLAVTEEARAALSGEDGSQPLTLADYASTSGITMELEGQIWVNAPIAEFNPNFVDATHHRLEYRHGAFFICSENLEVKARPLPVPAYSSEKDKQGIPYVNYAVTHSDRVRISPVQGCTFGCKFCDMSFKHRYEFMPLKGLIGSIRRALVDEVLPARHVLISGGVPREEDWPKLYEVYETVPAEFPHVPVDVMMTPVPGKLDLKQLRAAGIQGLSINIELFNRQVAQKIMRKKAQITLESFLDFISNAVNLFGQGRVRSLLMVGIEPIESTLAGVKALAERGCEPVLSPFRPDPATPMRDEAPPSTEVLEKVYLRAAEIVDQYGGKLGPRCIPCMHNTLSFPDGSDFYYVTGKETSGWQWAGGTAPLPQP